MRTSGGVAGFAVSAVLAGALLAPPAAVADPVDRLTIHQKVGQLVMFGVRGRVLTAHERRTIRRAHLGAVILFSRNYADRSQLRRLTDRIQTASRNGNRFGIGALIAVDQEGGQVKRFPDMPPWRSAPEIGRTGDTSIAYGEGTATGKALRSAGVNVNLAPVADLDLPPNHVMRARSFGSNRYLAARMTKAFAGGLQSQRVAATAKHFPGLGGATINTDYGPSYVHRSRWQLRHVDAVPFVRGVNGGIRMIMLSHAMYPRDGGNRPASMNPRIAKKRLRKGFGFEGVAISDALEAVGWRFDGVLSKACAKTVAAGVDLALITSGVDAARSCAAAIRRAVRDGRIGKARLDQAVTRVLELKQWLGLTRSG